jgi:translocation and assembly module TamB
MKQDSENNSDNHLSLKQKEPQNQAAASASWWRKVMIALFIVLLGSAGSGLIYGWYFLQRKLVPLIETEAGNYLHRPLDLGKLKTISPTGARFGSSTLPATNNNPDFVKVNGVKINLAPLYFLRTRKLKIDIILEKPDVYIEQNKSKEWTPTDFGSDEPSKGGIKVEVTSIQLLGGQLSLVAYDSEAAALNPAVVAKIDQIIVRPLKDRIEFDAEAKLAQGGKFAVDGQGNTKTGIIDIGVVGDDLNAKEVSNLVALPIGFGQGDINGQLNIKITDAPIPELQGTLDLDRVSLQIPNLVKPFSNSNGKVHFQGSKIKLDNIATNFGEVLGKASGSLDLAGKGDYQLNTKVNAIEASKIIQALELEAPVPIQGKINGNVAVRGALENPIIGFKLATTGDSQIDRVDFKQINADLEIIGTTLSVQQFTSIPKSGGTIAGNGKLELDGLQNLAFNIFAKDVSGKAIASSYNQKLPVDLGNISGQTNISAQAGDLSTLRFRKGDASFTLGNGVVAVDNLDYAQGVWRSDVTTSGVEFGSLPFGEGSAPTIAKGLIDGNFKVSGTKDVGNLDLVDATGKADLNTVGGKLVLPKISLADGNWAADVKTKNLQLQRLFPDLPPEFNDNLSGNVYLTGNIPDDAQPQTLINGFGDLNLAQGKVKLENLKIVDQNWTAIALGKDLKLKELSSTTPEQFAGLVNGSLKLAGTTDNITPQGIKATGNGSLTLPEGTFEAKKLAIANGEFKAQVVPQKVDLSLFADPNSDDLELKGQLGGQLKVTGKVDNLSPTAVSATGDLTFSQGIDFLASPFGAKVAWNGRRLDMLKAKGKNLDAQGYLELDPTFFSDIPDKLAAVDHFAFDVAQAQEIDITKLRLTLPSWATNLDYSGKGNFSGQISGIPAEMKIVGNLGVKDFKVEGIEFDPLLAGNVRISPETGVSLNLQEVITEPLFSTAADLDPKLKPLDQIKLVLDQNFSPLAFAIAHDYQAIKGKGKQEIIDISTQNISVGLLKTIALKSDDLKIPENIAIQPVSGELSGDFRLNLNTLATSGENVVIESPALASIRGDLLKGDFQYVDGYFAIQDVEFHQRNSTYQLQGNIKQKPDDFIVDGQVTIDGGQIQDILVALQIFELTDLSRIFSDRNYGNSQDLYQSLPSSKPPLFKVGLENTAVFDQLQLLSAIQAWLDSLKQQQQTAIIPPIKDLRGTFNGKIDVSGSLNTGLNSEFQFLGEKWQWGNLIGKKIIAKGNIKQNILTLLPISIQLEDSQTSDSSKSKQFDPSSPTLLFTGIFGGERQSGQFRLIEVPVNLIEQLFSFPPELALDGLINATASIAGTPEDPQARGEIIIDDASLNETSIQSTKGSFNYRSSRLDFSASSNIVEDADPLILKGSIPYQLPFAKVEPTSDLLELQLNVKDKGLALLDIFSRGELKWIDGQGEIVLDIAGVLDPKRNLPRKLVAKGKATIEDAVISAKKLPNNLLTNINSEVFFDLNNIRVNNFQGDFGGGKIQAVGTVPLNESGSLDPLTIGINNITVDIPKLYDGGVQGNLQILGKATEPSIAGDVTLFDGTILLVNESEPNSQENNSTPGSKISAIKRRNAEEGIAAITQYRNFNLRLGENIQISQPPLFTFSATGNLNINGTFIEPSPDGTITLERGQVNLFTTQLSLSRDYQNTARFSSNNVLDPFLDVLLVGSAIETTGRRSISGEVSPTEKPDADSLGTVETVRVSAKVKGLASQITNKIELTSSPPRSQAEIVALLGGGFVETLANNNSTLGLATLAGSALFGSLNSEFNNAFPIGELRLFPTQIIDDQDNPDNGTSDGIAGELAFNLFDNFSFSVLRILNINDIPTQYGFRYRLNKNFVLRGSTDFKAIQSDENLQTSNEDQGNTKVLLEFESRF